MRGRPKQQKPDDAPSNSSLPVSSWTQKWLFLLLPQMLSVFLNWIAFFNLLGAQDWWCLLHLEDLHNIRKVGITEKYNNNALFALDKHLCIINELPSNLDVLLSIFAQDNEIYCPENMLFVTSCFAKVKLEVCFHCCCCVSCLEDNMKVQEHKKAKLLQKQLLSWEFLHGWRYQRTFIFKMWEVIIKSLLDLQPGKVL